MNPKETEGIEKEERIEDGREYQKAKITRHTQTCHDWAIHYRTDVRHRKKKRVEERIIVNFRECMCVCRSG